jgi:hypothetical protein
MAHGQRVMMKIFRLAQGNKNASTSDLPSSQNLQGKFLEDQDSNGNLTITALNTPGITWASFQSNIVKVETNADGSSCIMVWDNQNNLQRFDVQHRNDFNSLTPESRIVNVKNSSGKIIPAEFTFYINPQRVNLVANKRFTEILTRGGYEIQHWGNALSEIQVTGKTGALYKTSTGEIPAPNAVIDITQSLAWIRLSQLRDLYDTDHAVKNQEALVLLGMNYYDHFYMGYFTSFSGPSAAAENPYQIDFGFSFKVQKEQTITRG